MLRDVDGHESLDAPRRSRRPRSGALDAHNKFGDSLDKVT